MLSMKKPGGKTGTLRQRGQMVDFLLNSIRIIAESKDTLVELLGTPDREWDLEEQQYHSTLSYLVDRGHMFKYDMIISSTPPASQRTFYLMTSSLTFTHYNKT